MIDILSYPQNDLEFKTRAAPLFRGVNITELIEDLPSHEGRKIRKRKKRSIPETLDFWEKEVGLSTPRDQAACGSCWSFPNVSTSFRETLSSLTYGYS